MKTERVVIDTNVLISAALFDESMPARARDHALHHGQLIGTHDTLQEIVERLLSPKFDPYVSRADREILLRRLHPLMEIVPIVQVIRACRDPRDDKFLEAAVNGRADTIISGDKDLLSLHPFGEIAIVSPGEYLARAAKKGE